MPNTRSAEKQMRVAERRRTRNRAVKSAVKTFIHKAEQSIVGAAEDAKTLVIQAQRSLDKAASKGVLHRSNAARRKTRLMKKLNAIAIADPTPVTKAARGTAARAATTKRGAKGTGSKRAATGSGSKRAAGSTSRATSTKRPTSRS